MVQGGVARTALGGLVLQDGISASWGVAGQAAVVLIRPEQLEISTDRTGPDGQLGWRPAIVRIVPAGVISRTTVLNTPPFDDIGPR